MARTRLLHTFAARESGEHVQLIRTVSSASPASLRRRMLAGTSGGLQRALGRVREAEADLEAAELTGDPRGLASALKKVRQHEELLLRGSFPDALRLRLPKLLRDHPATEERIIRLMALADADGDANAGYPALPVR